MLNYVPLNMLLVHSEITEPSKIDISRHVPKNASEIFFEVQGEGYITGSYHINVSNCCSVCMNSDNGMIEYCAKKNKTITITIRGYSISDRYQK